MEITSDTFSPRRYLPLQKNFSLRQKVPVKSILSKISQITSKMNLLTPKEVIKCKIVFSTNDIKQPAYAKAEAGCFPSLL